MRSNIALALATLALLCGASYVLPPTPRAPKPAAVPLFFDDFSRDSGRWTFDRDSVWSVRGGALWAELPDQRQMRSFAFAGSEDWGDYAVDVDMCQLRGVDKGVVVRVRGNSGTAVDVRGPGYQDVVVYRGEMPLGRARAPSGNAVWHHLRVESRGASTTVVLDGTNSYGNDVASGVYFCSLETPGGSGVASSTKIVVIR